MLNAYARLKKATGTHFLKNRMKHPIYFDVNSDFDSKT